MTFISVIVRGLLRRPVRTCLTVAGIAIGIAAVVALVGLSGGFEKSWESGMKARGTDIVVNNMGSSMMPKPFPAEARDRVAAQAGVDAATGLLVEFISVESAGMMFISAREWGGFDWANLKLVEGTLPKSADEKVVLLGTNAAAALKKKPGDAIQIDVAELHVAGIVDGGAWVENSSVILSLPLYQEITGNQGKINVIDVRAKPGMSTSGIEDLCNRINGVVAEAKAVPAGDHIRQSQSFKVVQAISWGTSLLAIVVGVLGVMNTMLMTVFERKQEIAVLLALGWTRARIVALILGESGLLGLAGGVVGVALGVIGVRVLEKTPAIRGFLEPDVNARLLLLSVSISVIVGVASGLYPAWRSSRLKPSQAIQG